MSLPYSPLVIQGEAPNTIHGSLVANQVAYGSGVNTITSNAGFQYNGTTFAFGTATLNPTIFFPAVYTFTPSSGVPLGFAMQFFNNPTVDGLGMVGGFFRADTDPAGTRNYGITFGTQMGARKQGSGTADITVGGVFEGIQNGTGLMNYLVAAEQRLFIHSAGIVTNGVHQLIGSVTTDSTGTFTNLYGIYANSITAGTSTNYLIFYANAPNGFYVTGNGSLSIGEPTPTSKMQVVGLQIFANNAAAVGGGLTVGAFYRTGGDPDTVCVVH